MAAELEYYKEHVAYGRHIELQRSAVAGLAATLSGAIIGELLKLRSINAVSASKHGDFVRIGLSIFLAECKTVRAI